MSLFLVENNAPEPEGNLLNEATDYIQGCLEGYYDVDEELLEACIDVINEANAATKRGLKELKNNSGLTVKNIKNNLKNTSDDILNHSIRVSKKVSNYDPKTLKKMLERRHSGNLEVTDNEKDAGAYVSKALNKKMLGLSIAEKIRREKLKNKPKVTSKVRTLSNPSQTEIEESVDMSVVIDYIQGCLEGYYDADNELLEACIDIMNENSSEVTVDDYNTVMESVEYLHEISTKRLIKKLNKEKGKIDPEAWGRGAESHYAYGKEYADTLRKMVAKVKKKDINEDDVAKDKDLYKFEYKAMKKANKLAKKGNKTGDYSKLGKHFFKQDMI